MLSTRYVIPAPVAVSCGRREATVHVPHEPRDGARFVEICMNLSYEGWRGRPVILADAGDHVIALTGSHRIAAATVARVAVSAIWMPEDLTAEDWDRIDAAHDDDDLLAALAEINDERGGDMDHIVAVMRAEVEGNALGLAA